MTKPPECFLTIVAITSGSFNISFKVFCVVSYIGNRGERTLVNTPVKQWNTDDVVTWIGQLGTWGDHFSDAIRKNSIDGRILLVMQESDATNRLNMKNELQRKVFLKEIAAMATTGLKPPVNLWEYKSTYPVFTLTMMVGFKLFPRTTVGYVYIFEYDTVYTPFMKYACSDFTEDDMQEATSFVRMVYLAFLPYWLVGRYAVAWTTDHYWVSRLVILFSVMATIYDITLFLTLFMRKWTKQDVNIHLCICRDNAISLTVSTILPWFLLNFMFYDNVVCLPIFHAVSIYKFYTMFK